MVRPHLLEVLGELARTRTDLSVLQGAIILEMERGHKPMYRGHEWGREHFAIIEAASYAVETAWELMKWVQFPEVASRLEDAEHRARQSLSALAAIRNASTQTAANASIESRMLRSQRIAPTAQDSRSVG